MYKFLILLFFLLSFQLSYSQDYKHPNIKNSVFKILNAFEHTEATAFYIGNNLFVTNAHVLLDLSLETFLMNEHKFIKTLSENPEYAKNKISDYFFIEYKQKDFPVKKVVALDFANDLAIIEMDSFFIENFKLIPFAFTALELKPFTKDLEGRKAYLYGFPNSKPYLPFWEADRNLKEITLKNISSSDDLEFFEADTNAEYVEGSSGGPVLFNGQVIGVVTSHVNNFLYFSSSNALKTLLKNPLPKPLTRMHEITREFITARRRAEVSGEEDWKFLNFMFRAFMRDYPSLSKGQQRALAYQIIKEAGEVVRKTQDWILMAGVRRIYKKWREDERVPELLREDVFDVEKSYLKGLFYLSKIDSKEGFKHLKKSADQNYNPALARLALYHYGKGNMLKYERYMKRAALRGHLRARIHLDLYYRNSDVLKMHFSELSLEKVWNFYGDNYFKYEKSKHPDQPRDIFTFYEEDAFRIKKTKHSYQFEKFLNEKFLNEKLGKDFCQKVFKQ